jgi:hypothetical protein
MEQGRFRRKGMMLHHTGLEPNGDVPILMTGEVDQFCLVGMARL